MKSILLFLVTFPTRVIVLILRAYHRYFSPYMPPLCRFYPTCSVYAAEAIESFGILRGGILALTRLVRCNPLCSGGIDLPPKPKNRPRNV